VTNSNSATPKRKYFVALKTTTDRFCSASATRSLAKQPYHHGYEGAVYVLSDVIVLAKEALIRADRVLIWPNASPGLTRPANKSSKIFWLGATGPGVITRRYLSGGWRFTERPWIFIVHDRRPRRRRIHVRAFDSCCIAAILRASLPLISSLSLTAFLRDLCAHTKQSCRPAVPPSVREDYKSKARDPPRLMNAHSLHLDSTMP
jgi:hypothetical protein